MVCKEDFLTWFQRLTADKRVEVVCNLISMFLPYEVRFFGTCLEDIGKQDFLDLRDAEKKANNTSSLPEVQCIRDKQVQRVLTLTVSLLQSCNHATSNGIFKILEKLDCSELNVIINNSPPDENPLEELLLLYTLALNHPAFTFEQKSVCGDILLMLQDAANNRSKLLSPNPVHMGMGLPLVYNSTSMQPCQAPTEELVHPESLPPCTIPVHPGSVPEVSSRGPPLLPPVPVESLCVPVPFPSPSHQQVPWQPILVPLEPTDLHRLLANQLPAHQTVLQSLTIKEAMALSDGELGAAGLPIGAIAQLRDSLGKYKKSNGICNMEKHEPSSHGRRKHDNLITEPSGMPRGAVPTQCYTCIYQCPTSQMRDLRLQPVSSSSSDSQSPPDTPAPTWDPPKRLCGKEVAGNEEDRGDLNSDTQAALNASLAKTLPWSRHPMMEAQVMNGMASRPMQEMFAPPPPYHPPFLNYLRPGYPIQYPPPPAYLPPHFPPPAPSCYNCGAAHMASDCQEATMEEITKPGQYHLDYTPTYQQSNECTSDK